MFSSIQHRHTISLQAHVTVAVGASGDHAVILVVLAPRQKQEPVNVKDARRVNHVNVEAEIVVRICLKYRRVDSTGSMLQPHSECNIIIKKL